MEYSFAQKQSWKKISAEIKKNAGWCCEACGAKHLSSSSGGKLVIVGVAHLDQNPNNNSRENLKTLCVNCHFAADRSFNKMKKKYGKQFHLFPQLKIW